MPEAKAPVIARQGWAGGSVPPDWQGLGQGGSQARREAQGRPVCVCWGVTGVRVTELP